MATKRIAAIDCGTNSIRLLVSDIDGDIKTDLVREMRIVRLGQDVDKTGRLAEEAIARTVAAAKEYAAQISEFGVETVRFCATSATRDAANAAEFADAIEAVLGVRPVVLSGDEEAAASFLGAARDLPALDEPVLVIDLGGGSTELVIGAGETVQAARSLDIGSVRMTERHLHSDPPTASEVAACIDDIDSALDASGLDLSSVQSVVGVAGTITTVVAHALALDGYDSARIHHASVPFGDIARSCRTLAESSVAERRAYPFMHPGRADVIGGGALILDRILRRLKHADPRLVTSEHDILDGIAWGMAV
ncbi:Ppx/GppA phosphatase family protein [soil metagenome]